MSQRTISTHDTRAVARYNLAQEILKSDNAQSILESLAEVKKGDRTFYVGSNGEMRINLSTGNVIRYTSDLLEAGIDTDEKLSELEKRLEWVNNNWFEIYEEGADGDWWEVHETLEEGIEAARYALDTKLTNVS